MSYRLEGVSNGRCFLSRGRGRGPRTSLARRKDFIGGASRRRPLDESGLFLLGGGGGGGVPAGGGRTVAPG